jgi:hypothetical protein
MIEFTKGEENLLVREILAQISNLKIESPDQLYGYFGGPFDQVSKFSTKHNLKFS